MRSNMSMREMLMDENELLLHNVHIHMVWPVGRHGELIAFGALDILEGGASMALLEQ